MTSLLVTNDFPPKLGGIQSYLDELWRRLPPEETTVVTTAYPGAPAWDARQDFRVERERARVLLPHAALARRVDRLARDVGADVVFLDPMLPLGAIGPKLRAAPYVVVAHGAEITVPGTFPGSRHVAARVLRGAAGVVAAGEYPARMAARAARTALPTLVVPPGVDVTRFAPLDVDARRAARARFGLPVESPVVLGVSRLVPRKGFDVLLRAAGALDDVTVVIGGAGRDRRRLEGLATRHAPGRVRFLGRVADADLPALYGCVDVFAMLCRDRWGGLEAEGFGIVFLEAAAAGVPAVAGRSGGSHEAVAHDETGLVVEPRDVDAVRHALDALLRDDGRRAAMGRAARDRAVAEFSYDVLVERLVPLTRGDLSVFESRCA
ncbi:MAG TPA: glycosyltransferase family 4 protein [Acidimicrobiia bacterium]|nr:glycosyltransferase family 4 protein [Acidimicrobiia bacterium]